MTNNIPIWLTKLSSEDIEFIKQFILHSGSFKSLAKYYDVSYPTVRAKTNSIIKKVKLYSSEKEDEFVELVKSMALDNKISLEDARILITHYLNEKKEN